MNKTQLIGRLGADPEVRSLNDGAKVTNLRLATTEAWKDRETGERRERTEWHRVTVWGDGPAMYLSHARKGGTLLVEGRLATREWMDAEGAERAMTKVVVKIRGGGQVRILADLEQASSGAEPGRRAESKPPELNL